MRKASQAELAQIWLATETLKFGDSLVIDIKPVSSANTGRRRLIMVDIENHFWICRNQQATYIAVTEEQILPCEIIRGEVWIESRPSDLTSRPQTLVA